MAKIKRQMVEKVDKNVEKVEPHTLLVGTTWEENLLAVSTICEHKNNSLPRDLPQVYTQHEFIQYSQQNTCTSILIVASFVLAKNWGTTENL